MRSLRNGWALVLACRGFRERIRALAANARYAFALIAHGKSKPFVTTVVIDGLSLTLDWAAAEHIPIREVLVRREYAPDDGWLPRRAETVIDVGANAGVFALDAARRVGPAGRVVAIEPNPVSRQRLVHNAAANGYVNRISVVGAALGEERAVGELVIDEHNTTTARVASVDQAAGHILIITLDEVVSDEHISVIDLLKIDVEGAELGVLRGGREALIRTRRVVLEVDDARTGSGVTRLLDESGFASVVTVPSGPDSGATIVFASRT